MNVVWLPSPKCLNVFIAGIEFQNDIEDGGKFRALAKN
jgi:hypothetical protein